MNETGGFVKDFFPNVKLFKKVIIIFVSLFWTNVQLPLRRVGDKMIKYIKEMIGFSK